MFRRECQNPGIHQSRPLCRFLSGQTFSGKMYYMFFIYMTHGLASRDRNASGCAFAPQSRPEPFHCDHIARWSARSGTTGRSGTGARLRSGTVPVPKLWCEHGLRELCWTKSFMFDLCAKYDLCKSVSIDSSAVFMCPRPLVRDWNDQRMLLLSLTSLFLEAINVHCTVNIHRWWRHLSPFRTNLAARSWIRSCWACLCMIIIVISTSALSRLQIGGIRHYLRWYQR